MKISGAEEWFSLIGGVMEGSGLLVAMIGISETRAAFSDRPSILARLKGRTRRVLSVFKPRKDVRILVHATDAALGSEEATLERGPLTFGGSAETRLIALQELAQRHEDALAEFGNRMNEAEKSQKRASRQMVAQLQATRSELLQAIRQAAAGGLTKETVGIFLFLLGVVFQTLGNLVG